MRPCFVSQFLYPFIVNALTYRSTTTLIPQLIPSNYIVINLNIMWSSATDDTRILAAAKATIEESIALAKTMQLDYRYIYQNYASSDQDVFSSYGQANKQRLIEISKKYDPNQVFQTLQPGYFKLDSGGGG